MAAQPTRDATARLYVLLPEAECKILVAGKIRKKTAAPLAIPVKAHRRADRDACGEAAAHTMLHRVPNELFHGRLWRAWCAGHGCALLRRRAVETTQRGGRAGGREGTRGSTWPDGG